MRAATKRNWKLEIGKWDYAARAEGGRTIGRERDGKIGLSRRWKG